ncbi:hypothetical protein CUB95_09770 [Prevotella intermedia]|nr:hypothetical protein CUB95_09770 [Prevotella intermedia]
MQGKSGSFAAQKSRFRNAKAQLPLFKDFIFTKLEGFWGVCLRVSRTSRRTRISREKLDFLEEKTSTKKENAPLCGAFSIIFRGLIPSNERTYKVNVDGKPTQRPLQTSQFSVARVPRCFTVRSTLLSNQNY